MEGYHETESGATGAYETTIARLSAESPVGREYGVVPGQPYAYRYTPPVGRLLITIGKHCGVGGTFRPGNRQLSAWMGYTSAGQMPMLLEQLAYDGHILYDATTGLITLLSDLSSPPLGDLDREDADSYDELEHFDSPNRSVAVVGYVYVIKCGNACKIGCATNVQRRFSQLSLPYKELMTTIESSDMYRDEAALHAHFAHKQINGEWFKLTAQDIAWIANWQTDPISTPDRDQIDGSESLDLSDSLPISTPDRVAPRTDAKYGSIRGPDRSTPRMEDSCLTTTRDSESVVVKTQIPCGENSISPTDHSIALLLAELGLTPGPGVFERGMAARSWTPQQIRDRYEYDQERIKTSNGKKHIGIFWTAFIAGELAPARADPAQPLDPAAYADDPGFTLGSQAPPEVESIRDHAARLLPPPTAATIREDTRDWMFLQCRLGAGDSDQEALAALESHRTAVRR